MTLLSQNILARSRQLEQQGHLKESQQLLKEALGFYPQDTALITAYVSVCDRLHDYVPTVEWIHKLRDLMGNKMTPYQHMLMRNYIYRTATWEWYEKELKWLKNNLDAGVSIPFYLLGLPLKLSEYKKAISSYYHKGKLSKVPVSRFDFSNRSFQNRKIKIGFVSANWRIHPEIDWSYGVYKNINTEDFLVYFYDLTPPNKKDMPYKQKIINISPKTYKNVAGLNEKQLADLIFFDQIDILVDMTGLTQGNKIGTFIQKPAPIQISWLGYLETLGDIPGYDYIIANHFSLPDKKQTEYPEKVLYLEPSYYPSDDPSEYPIVTRKELGLPEKNFVFGCAGQDYKLTPEYFTIWMQILRRVPNSVLWLYALNPILIKNLQKEAQKNGVSPERLVFFSYMKHPKYVAALKCADLMLDTQYYNANTTAADALFMGIPVLTCPQERLTSRLVGSILQTLEMPELITQNEAEYEEKAVFYATHPTQFNQVKEKLAKNIKNTDFFNSKKYAEKFGQICMDLVKNYQK